MRSHYKTVIRKQDIGMRISALYRQQQLSIGILDAAGPDELKETLDWYMANMNCALHVVTLEDRLEEYGLAVHLLPFACDHRRADQCLCR